MERTQEIRHWGSLRAAVAAAVVAAATVGSGATALAQAPKIKVGRTTGASGFHLPTYVAMDRGLFKAEGLDAEFVNMTAGEIVRAVSDLSQSLAEELSSPLRIGIGIHTGPAVVGRMGYGETTYLTAVGDTVHVASRLQDLTKQYDCQLVISKEVAARAGADTTSYPRHELPVRNRSEPVAIHIIDDVRALLGALEARQEHTQTPRT